MGIRFRCPNGHKLHVKAFLAGKRGVCPDCGSKVDIPLHSDPSLVREKQERDGGRSEDLDEPLAAELILPVAGRESTVRATGPGDDIALALPAAAAIAPRSRRGEAADTTAAATDALSESPTAKWFVRPPAGGQYGPAEGDLLRSWIAEGRVTHDAYVWREGWTEWQLAGDVLKTVLDATIGTIGPSNEISIQVPNDNGVAIIDTHRRPDSAQVYRRKKSKKTATVVVVLLGLACAALLAALIYVVRFMRK